MNFPAVDNKRNWMMWIPQRVDIPLQIPQDMYYKWKKRKQRILFILHSINLKRHNLVMQNCSKMVFHCFTPYNQDLWLDFAEFLQIYNLTLMFFIVFSIPVKHRCGRFIIKRNCISISCPPISFLIFSWAPKLLNFLHACRPLEWFSLYFWL